MQKLLWTSQRDAQLLTPSLSLCQWDLKSGMVLEVSVSKHQGKPEAICCTRPLILALCDLSVRSFASLMGRACEGGILGAEVRFAPCSLKGTAFELLLSHGNIAFSPLLYRSFLPQSISSLPSLVTWALLLCVVTMSATSRRKAGKWLAICTVNEEVLVGMWKGSLEVLRIFVGEGRGKMPPHG